MNPRINVRNLQNPLRWGGAGPGKAWHHIIPFSLLREVWNRLVDQHIATTLPEARVAIRQYLVLADRSLPDLDSLIDRMRAVNVDQKRASHHQLQPLDVAEVLLLQTAAVWPAWNAVQAPTPRSDDPDDSYFDRFTSGLTAEEAARMRAIETLFHDFQIFVNAGPAPGPGNLRALAEAASIHRGALLCDLPIRYRAEMWVKESGGWRKRRDGERSTAAGTA